jgi:hypothetical protein
MVVADVGIIPPGILATYAGRRFVGDTAMLLAPVSSGAIAEAYRKVILAATLARLDPHDRSLT